MTIKLFFELETDWWLNKHLLVRGRGACSSILAVKYNTVLLAQSPSEIVMMMTTTSTTTTLRYSIQFIWVL